MATSGRWPPSQTAQVQNISSVAESPVGRCCSRTYRGRKETRIPACSWVSHLHTGPSPTWQVGGGEFFLKHRAAQLASRFCLNPPIADCSAGKKLKFLPGPTRARAHPKASSIYEVQTMCQALIWELAIGNIREQNVGTPYIPGAH